MCDNRRRSPSAVKSDRAELRLSTPSMATRLSGSAIAVAAIVAILGLIVVAVMALRLAGSALDGERLPPPRIEKGTDRAPRGTEMP